MNERIEELARQATDFVSHIPCVIDREQSKTIYTIKLAELIVKECASEYNKLVNGDAVVLPKDREHAEALVRVGMFYLENNK